MTHKKIVVLIAALAFVSAGTCAVWQMVKPAVHMYRSTTLGVSFSYPNDFLLVGHEGTGGGATKVLVLGEEAALTEAMHQSIPTEGPPTITLSFYANEGVTNLEDWVRTKQVSNFHLSMPPLGGTLAPTEVAHLPALRYHVSGLYEAEYIVFMYGTNVVVVTADDRGARTEHDLQTILTSMKIIQ